MLNIKNLSQKEKKIIKDWIQSFEEQCFNFQLSFGPFDDNHSPPLEDQHLYELFTGESGDPLNVKEKLKEKSKPSRHWL